MFQNVIFSIIITTSCTEQDIIGHPMYYLYMKVSLRLRLSEFLDIRHMKTRKVFSHTQRPPFLPGKYPWNSFLSEAVSITEP